MGLAGMHCATTAQFAMIVHAWIAQADCHAHGLGRRCFNFGCGQRVLSQQKLSNVQTSRGILVWFSPLSEIANKLTAKIGPYSVGSLRVLC